MNALQTRLHIKQLKDKIKTAEKANDKLLFKLFVLMLLVALAAFLVQGRINFFM